MADPLENEKLIMEQMQSRKQNVDLIATMQTTVEQGMDKLSQLAESLTLEKDEFFQVIGGGEFQNYVDEQLGEAKGLIFSFAMLAMLRNPGMHSESDRKLRKELASLREGIRGDPGTLKVFPKGLLRQSGAVLHIDLKKDEKTD